MIIQVPFGTAQTGVGYQFYDASGWVGSRVTAGISAGPVTGLYSADATIPAGATGVHWDSDDETGWTEDLREALASDATAIQSAAAAALTAYDPPTRAEATADKDAIIAELAAIKAKTDNLPADPASDSSIPSIEDIIGAAGGLTPETVQALTNADQIILASLYEPSESPSVVLPDPSGDVDITNVYLDTEDVIGEVVEGIKVVFNVASPKQLSASGRVVLGIARSVTTDDTGRLLIGLESGVEYIAVGEDVLGPNPLTFTPTGALYNLADDLIP